MIQIQCFTFNPYQENTYVLFDDSKECIIIDPGCYGPEEKKELSDFISKETLIPVLLLNTHCHIDHILGNAYVSDTYGLLPRFHPLELEVMRAASVYGPTMGFKLDSPPEPVDFLNENETVNFGNSALHLLLTPGHSPGSLIFYNKEQKFAIGGDVLFYNSIGRTDLPGGSFEILMDSIKYKLFKLEDDYIIYPGHGPKTGIGFEKLHNPFLKL